MDDIFDYDFTMGGGDQTYFGGNTLGDTSWIDNFDWSGALDNLDFSGLNLGGLDLGGIDLGGLGYDTGAFDLSGLDLGGSGYDTGAFGDYGSTDAEAQEGGFYGNIPGQAEYDPRTNSTILYNSDGSIRDMIVHDERIYDVEAQPGGFYGNTPNATYDPKTNTTTIRNDKGEVIRTVYHEGGPGGAGSSGSGTGGGKGDDASKSQNPLLNKDNALLIALLGGLMGLLGKGSTNKGPVGYQGGIPKYTATRVPGRGVEYTRAAQGGLMGLEEGGETRPARYLRGGTDGMADKIQTDIDGKQPARLSHGEFVLPADIVSALGSGNSEAGADVLYDMMDRVRKNAYGRKKQITPVNKRKVLPA